MSSPSKTQYFHKIFTQLWICLLLYTCNSLQVKGQYDPIFREKITGVNFSGPSRPPMTSEMISSISDAHASWVAFIPEAVTYKQNLQLVYDRDRGWWSETTKANIQAIKIAKAQGLKVMLKPHMVLGYDRSTFPRRERMPNMSREERRKAFQEFLASQPDMTDASTWRGDFAPLNKKDWEKWEEQYAQYILACAAIADSMNVEMFCIGTELSTSARTREAFWRTLIQQVRDVYKGAITYSANWDSYEKIPFWDAVDFIGVNAYFPLHDASHPTMRQLVNGWRPYVKKLKNLNRRTGKPIIFTEYGYRNIDYAAKAPWESSRRNITINEEVQADAYQALYQAFWQEKWFGGGFLWKWFYKMPRREDTDFSPQGKPAMDVVKQWYAKEK